jgi:hypothetical protein
MTWFKHGRLVAGVVGVLGMLMLASTAVAQLRTIPADAERGEMRHISGMLVELNGQRVQLSAGAQIRDTSNRTIVPSALPGIALVKFTLDPQGQVHRIWILSPVEAAQPDLRK